MPVIPLSQPISDVNMVPYAGCGSWEDVYAAWQRSDGQYYWRIWRSIVPLNRSYCERRDAQAFEMTERGDRNARDAILRIIQRDCNVTKRARAEKLLERLDAA